jgi:hypothetical protein
MRSRYLLPSLLSLLFLAWVFWSFSQLLYSTASDAEGRVTRGELFVYLLSPMSADHPLHYFFRSWQQVDLADWLAERIPIVLLATFFWMTFIAVGHLLFLLIGYRPKVTLAEWILLSWGIGGAVVALMVQGLGLAGWAHPWVLLPIMMSSLMAGLLLRRGGPTLVLMPRAGGEALALLVALPILILIALSAILPTPDYDAHAYHLLGPKEYFLNGKIDFLRHNVYTTFPFLTEMFSLLGMVMAREWFTGGLVGQWTLSAYGPATSLMIYFVTRRLFGPHAGVWAGIIYATSPWTYRLSSIPYVEGAMNFYLSAGLLALLTESIPSRRGLVVGLMAGAAFGCKYPALAMVAGPLAVGLFVIQRGQLMRELSWFVVGFLSLSAVWLIRNIAWTGNPIFPLLDPMFGSNFWDVDRYERFHDAHQSTVFSWMNALGFVQDILVRSDWQSALLFAGVPFVFLLRPRSGSLVLLLFIVYQFLVFYFGTHRLDRFFLAIVPIAAMLSGAGLALLMERGNRWILLPTVAMVLIYNTLFGLTPLAGMNLFASRIEQAREVSRSAISPTLSTISATRPIPMEATVLYVGLAAVYESPVRARYNTVFDESLFLMLISDPGKNAPELLPSDEIRARLIGAGIDYVLVDWSWIDRYREPGNYGFPDFIQKSLLVNLVRNDLLRPVKHEAAWDLYHVVKERPAR